MSDRCLVSSLSIPGSVADLERAGITLQMKEFKVIQLELKPLGSAEWAKCPLGLSSRVFVWPRLLLEMKVCQPKTLSINNPPPSPEVMYALPCNLIIITGRRTLFLITAME